ncbi:hypothetical protein Tco_1228985 [Tanacetum coccineum]
MERMWWFVVATAWLSPPPQRWRQAARVPRGTARGVCAATARRFINKLLARLLSPTPHGAAVVAVPSSDRHHDGGCRRLCRGGGGGTRLVEMEVIVASNEDDSEGSSGGVVMMGKRRGRGLKQREAWQRRGCAGAVTRWGDKDSGDRDDEDGVVAVTSSPKKVAGKTAGGGAENGEEGGGRILDYVCV